MRRTSPETLRRLRERTEQRRAAGLIPEYKTSARVAAPPRPPQADYRYPLCVHEGPIVEACTTCSGDARHVRACFHPTADRDKCTRAQLRGDVQGCDHCPDRETPNHEDKAHAEARDTAEARDGGE